ncbi:MAG TPA: 16S rRNA (cytidine(1402)-2'-O)-methyltransferase [Terriglobia bacterium]|nr:16S rRNA (cytidine(1402)-2'-O)-methyltransferase [Terriglobia bacterium]
MTPKPGQPRARVAAKDPAGRLYLVGSPIGNLEDITLRAIRTLKEVDVVACEDTRRTQRLLDHYRIETPTVSYHEHNELTRAPELIIAMEEGSSIALVSDAGMPVISDPGYRLVKLAIRHGLPVVPVPGASAFVAALSASGLPIDRFRFLGFLPHKKTQRRQAIEELKPTQKTQVFYEAPHRILETLGDIRKILGDRPLVVAREVTKIHEEFVRGSAAEVLEHLKKKPVKGEITVLVGPVADSNHGAASEPERPIRKELEQVMADRDLDERAALKVVARARGVSRSEAYRQWQSEKSSDK